MFLRFGHPLASLPVLSIKDLEKYPFVTYDQELENRKNVLSQKESVLKDAEAKYKTYQDKIVNYNTTIQNFENLTAANAKGNAEEIKAAMSDVENSLITHTTGTKDTLEQQVNDFKTNAENLRTAYKDGVEGVTKDQVEEAEELQERAEIELAKYTDMYGTVAAIATGKADEINAQQQKIKNGFIDAETGSKESLENQLANFTANYELLKTAMDENQPGVTQKMVDNAHELVDKATEELDKLEGNSETAGKNGTEGVSDGMKDKKSLDSVSKAGKGILDRIGSSLSGSYNLAFKEGQNVPKGYSNGLSGLFEMVNEKARELVNGGLTTIQKTQDSHSPSRKSRKSGRFLGQGYWLGIEDEIAETKKKAQALSATALAGVSGNPIDSINSKFAGIRMNSESVFASQSMSRVVTNSPNVEIKFTGDVNINNDMDVDDFNRRVSTAIVQTLDGEASRWGG